MNQKLNYNEISIKEYIEWKLNIDVFELEKNRYEKHLINRSYYHCNCNDLYECNIKNISSRAYRTWIPYYSNLIL